MTTSELRENLITQTSKTLTDDAVRDHSALRLHPAGSVLFAMYGATIGRVAQLGIDATVNQAVCVFSQPSRLDPEFTLLSLQASRDYLIEMAAGGGQPNLNAEKIANHRIACPPLDEQTRIVEVVKQRLDQIDGISEKLRDSIDLGRERRSALIAAAVTGQIDVEDAA